MESPPIPQQFTKKPKSRLDPFRRAVWRGLGVLLPPLLTIVIFVWIGNTVRIYLLVPIEDKAHDLLLTQYEKRILDEDQLTEEVVDGRVTIDGVPYRRYSDGRFLPEADLQYVRQVVGGGVMPETSSGVYSVFINNKYLRRSRVIPLFLFVFLLLLFFLGRFLAAGVGGFFWGQFEKVIDNLPLVRNVYSSVKQVTDFMFSEQEIEYTRVIAVEYPRKGVWSLGLVTGESMADIRCAANEPVLSVLIPSSPMPVTGYTITVKRSEAIDLNITLDQAFQFVVSCGVVVPPQQIIKPSPPQLPDQTVEGEADPSIQGEGI